MSEVLQLDLQKISNKLKPLATVQASKESMISDSYDVNTKNFLSFIIETIEAAKAIESTSTDTVIYKVNGLIKDANELLSNYFENNSLSAYYGNVLESSLNALSESLKQTGESFNVDNVKSTVVDVLKTLNSANETERQKQFETSLSSFKEEFAETFTEEIESKTEVIQKDVEKKVQEEVERNKDKFEKEINRSTKLLLYKTVPEYMKSLDKVFSKNFKQYIEANFTNKAKQLTIANKLRNTFNGILMPFAFAAKYVKSAKDGLFSIGRKVKKNLSEKILGPLSAWKNRVKIRVGEKLHEMKVGFRRATRFIRRPKKMLGLWLGRVKKKLDSSDSLSTMRKFGLLGLMIKGIMNLIRRTKKNFRLLSQMDFKPFKFLSVATNSVNEFIESVSSHTTIILSNLKLYFDQNVVEGYDVRKKLGFWGKLKAKFKKKGATGGGFNLLSFFTSLPGLVKMFKRIWKIIKKIYKFIKSVFKFIWKVSKSLIKGIARFIGKSLAKIGTKLGWKAAANAGTKMAKWGSKGVKTAKVAKVAKVAKGAKGGKGVVAAIKNIPKNIKNLKSVQKAKGIVKALKPSNLVAAAKGSKFLAKGGMKAAAKAAGKAAGKAVGKGLAKAIPSPASTIMAFAMDGAFAYMEAQDTDAMAKLYGIKASEVGAQQRTSYVIAGTLVGGSSLLDADWSSPASIGMAALDTGMTMMKWAGAGAMIGSVIPGVGTLVGAAVGAAVGLVFSLIGTQRLAKAINWICDTAKTVWKYLKWTPLGLLGYGLFYAGKALWAVGKGLVKGIAWIGKALWSVGKGLVKGVAWVGKMGWKAIKGIGKGIAWLGKMTWKGIKNLWTGAKNLTKKLGNAIVATRQKIGKFFSSIKDKISNGINALADKVKNKLSNIGSRLKNSLGRIGKSLLSTIFPFSPLLSGVGKAVGKFFKGVKNFFFGEDESEKQLEEVKSQLKNINAVASNSYTSVLHQKLQEHIILDSKPKEGTDVSQSAKTDVFDISKLTDLMNDLLDVPPTLIPVPQKTEEKEETPATIAAKHWETQPST